jgi:hypothetical protein
MYAGRPDNTGSEDMHFRPTPARRAPGLLRSGSAIPEVHADRTAQFFTRPCSQRYSGPSSQQGLCHCKSQTGCGARDNGMEPIQSNIPNHFSPIQGLLKFQRALSLPGSNLASVGVLRPTAVRAMGSLQSGTDLGMMR